MITITIYQDQKGKTTGFNCIGHAGYADYGNDVVCAGVSALVINTVNSLEILTKAKFDISDNSKTGELNVKLAQPAKDDVALLIDSMILGLKGIQKDYGNDFIILKFKEV